MAAAYLVYLPDTFSSKNLENGNNMVIVHANDATDAKAMAKACMSAGGSNAQWDNATVTAIVAGSNPLGFRFIVKEYLPNGTLGRTADITAAGSGQDTVDEIGTALATALGGGASYNTTSQKLTLTSSGNGAGDRSLVVEVYPPAATGQDYPIPGFVASKTHNGAASAELSFTLCADAFSIPAVYAKGKMQL